jgi:hypothetical protein
VPRARRRVAGEAFAGGDEDEAEAAAERAAPTRPRVRVRPETLQMFFVQEPVQLGVRQRIRNGLLSS